MPKNSTIYLLVHPKPQTKVMSMYINPSMDIIPQSTDVPDLGIIMSKDCSFDSHISSLSRKCLPLTLSDPGYFRQLTIRGGGGALKGSPPLRSRKLLCQSSPYHTLNFTRCFWHDPIGIFQKFAILTILQRFQNKK